MQTTVQLDILSAIDAMERGINRAVDNADNG